MELSKQDEALIRALYEAFWGSLLNANIELYSAALADDYRLIGTTEKEVFFNKQEAIGFLKETAEQLTGNIERRNNRIKMEAIDTLILITEQFDAYVIIETDWTFYGKTRVSTWMQQKPEGWKLIQQHFSFPDSKAEEGQTIGLEKVSKENLELKEAVKRRTVELENKNRELEIETALEKVRARTMAMQKSEELPDAANILFQQVQLLGMPAWSAGYCIWNDDHRAITLWMSSAGLVQKPFRAPVTEDPSFIHFYEAWKRSETFYVEEIGGKELVSHYKYMCKLPVVGEMLNKFVDEGGSLPVFQIYHLAFFKQGFLLFITYEPVPEAHNIFKRFGKVFEQTYTRFLDLQKAEAQVREAQIESGLERVRSRSLAMHNTSELQEVIHTVHKELLNLNIAINGGSFIAINKDIDTLLRCWGSGGTADTSEEVRLPLYEKPFCTNLINRIKSAPGFFTEEYTQKEKKDFFTFLLKYAPWSKLDSKQKNEIVSTPGGYTRSCCVSKHTSVFIINHFGEKFSDADNEILKRFGKVFEQTYTRFLDLQKAEAQAREATIEAALEKIRSRSLAMHYSHELKEVITVFFEKLNELGVLLGTVGIILFDHKKKEVFSWVATSLQDPQLVVAPFNQSMMESENFLSDSWSSMTEKSELLNKVYTKKQKDKYFEYLFDNNDLIQIPAGAREALRKIDSHIICFFPNEQSALFVDSLDGSVYSNDSIAILRRTGIVFEQAYIRFLDIQKVEAQAREAQIQLALERVRARTMAMFKSDELSEVVFILFQQFKDLGEMPDQATIGIINENDWVIEYWVTMYGSQNNKVYKFSIDEPNVTNKIYKAWKEQQKSIAIDLSGKELRDFMQYRQSMGGAVVNENEKRRIINVAFFSKGIINVQSNEERSAESIQLLERFAGVFDLTYTRFLDLQKAEAQAREAQIEAALERVRSRTLAMHKSDELADAAFVLFQQLNQLGIVHERINIGIVNEQDKQIDFWITEQGGNHIHTRFSGSIDEPTTLSKMYAGWKAGQKSTAVDLSGSELKDWLRYLNDEIGIPFDTAFAHDRRVQTASFFSQGMLVVTTPEPPGPEAIPILEKFASVFNLTYTRFNDLQIAEAQTHKANIEVALERVRARALAMQQPEELVEVADVMRHEMGLLGVEELETSSIYINKENTGEAECWYSLKGVRGEEKTKVSDHFNLVYKDTWVGRQMFDFYQTNKKEISIVMQGENRKEWINYCSKQSPVFQGYYGETIPDRTYHLCKFSNGSIGAATPGDISAESRDLLSRAASVFSLAYSRFKDLTQARFDLQQLKTEKQRAEEALTELQVTQKQLIQSEKMASLGELTAGIAHEIQNPLNFVNNFSEVNKELLAELNEEIEKGNYKEVKIIAKDVMANEEKINHHGKRADGIVKGMLQHSRSTSTTKEATDINKLADEYLHLAYLGLRAKDKLFNTALKTDYDETLKKINVIPQDIGRVLLNLFNNAFYAVSEKQKAESIKQKAYEPTVSVCTKKTIDHIEISVKDNGNGISQKIVDKIFQPFFTTKPTGQGTGLGLSLAYDIVKAHNGEIKVETKDGEETEFIVQLPLNQTL